MVRVLPKLARQKTTPLYNIGAVSRLTGLPVWTLRWIEKHELLCPQRTDGNQRLFSDEDVELLLQIRDLMAEGVNLPGVRVILRMRVTYVRGHKSGQ